MKQEMGECELASLSITYISISQIDTCSLLLLLKGAATTGSTKSKNSAQYSHSYVAKLNNFHLPKIEGIVLKSFHINH